MPFLQTNIAKLPSCRGPTRSPGPGASVWTPAQGGQDGGRELGPIDNVLRFPERALETLAHVQRRGIAVLAGALADLRFPTV